MKDNKNLNAEIIEKITEETNTESKGTITSDGGSKNAEKALRSVAKKLDDTILKIKNAFHGFFFVAIILAVILAVVFYKTKNSGTLTVDLPAIHFSYLKLAIMAAVISLIGVISTGSKK